MDISDESDILSLDGSLEPHVIEMREQELRNMQPEAKHKAPKGLMPSNPLKRPHSPQPEGDSKPLELFSKCPPCKDCMQHTVCEPCERLGFKCNLWPFLPLAPKEPGLKEPPHAANKEKVEAPEKKISGLWSLKGAYPPEDKNVVLTPGGPKMVVS